MRSFIALLLVAGLSSACATRSPRSDPAALKAAVTATEQAFADSMARRDRAAFEAFIADDAVFLNNDHPLRGKAAITAHWGRFFEKPEAPFAWTPDLVEVLDDGSLAQTTGPVLVGGTAVARFLSVWRRAPDGGWKIVFDQGWDLCARPSP